MHMFFEYIERMNRDVCILDEIQLFDPISRLFVVLSLLPETLES